MAQRFQSLCGDSRLGCPAATIFVAAALSGAAIKTSLYVLRFVSAVDQGHNMFGVALAGCSVLRERLVEACKVFL